MKKLCKALFLTILLTGCSSPDKQEPATGLDKASEASLETARPDTIETEIALEGMAETIEMYLLKSPDNFPLFFSTYIPADMQTETIRSDKGTTIRVMANFGGTLNEDACLTIFAFPPDATGEEARKMAEETAQSVSNVSEEDTRYPWAETVYSLQGDRLGFLALAQKNDSWFYLLSVYPPEYGDGMGPRINQIVQKWRWEDNQFLEAR